MQKHDVLVSFTDNEDKNAPSGANVYLAGKSQYPRDGYEPAADRVAYLKGDKNRFKKPLIAPKEQEPSAPVSDRKEKK